MPSSHQSLSLFLSYRGSLSRWQQEGILSREIAIYLLHIQNGIFDNISIFSYCRADNALIQENAETDSRYRAINIIAPPHWLSGKTFLWSLIGPFIYRAKLAKSAVLKTNQISGSWSAIIARLLTDRPLLLRMGYSLSRRFRKNGDLFRSFIANIVESTGFRVAAHILVNNQQMVAQIQTKGHGSKMSLLPTYVDINQFSEKPGHDFKKPLVTVGRLCPQKNLANLIRACAIIQRRLVIYGDGPLYVELKQVAKASKADVVFAGALQNTQLAERLKDHGIFILPSLHEGLPKALIEAMACGLICLGSDIPDITDIIEDGVNGYLIDGFEPQDIAATICKALEQEEPQIGCAARQTIERSFGLETYADGEARIFRRLS